jgi:hypothetical protein
MIGLGLYGFQTAYGGSRYLVAGLVGMLLGFVVALWGARTRQPLIVVTAATVGVFFLFGGAVAVPEEAAAGFLPSPGALIALVDGAVSGWAKLLTSSPPVGARDNLLVVPYVCGLVAAVLALTIARRTRRGAFAVVPAVAVLAISILFGTEEPASLILQGAVFAVVAIGWTSLHRRAERRVDIGTGRSGRAFGMVIVLALAGLAALTLGASIPGAGTNPRVVLRDQTEPPFDPRNHPSPLSSYRRYTDEEQWKNTTLFTVDGLGPNELLRLAVLDSYDGVVYSVGAGPGSSGYFERVGESVASSVEGDPRPVTVTVEDYTDVWVPGAGYLDGIEFGGPRADVLRDGFRYNAATGTAAESSRLQKGDRFVTEAVLPPAPGDGEPADVKQPDAVEIEDVQALGSDYVAQAFPAGTPAPSSYQQVTDGIVKKLNENGASSDDPNFKDQFDTRPGHHARRLQGMAEEGGVLIGNDEQYAPIAALMARSLGVPARVVMGFKVPEDSSPSRPSAITGADVQAWIEVDIEGVGWVPAGLIEPSNPKPQVRPKPVSSQQSTDPPPPPPTVPPTEDDEVEANKVKCGDGEESTDGSASSGTGSEAGESASGADCPPPPDEGLSIPRWVFVAAGATLLPIAVLAAFTGLIAGLKSRRRSRRRTTGAPSTRVDGGWHEMIDLASDMGSPIPVLATRNEGAQLMGVDAAVGLARHADVGIFGPTDLTEDWVEHYWADVDRTRSAMTADLSRMERWRVLVSLASLRASFDRWRFDRRVRRTSGAHAGDGTGEPAGHGGGTVGVPAGDDGEDDTATVGADAGPNSTWWRDDES